MSRGRVAPGGVVRDGVDNAVSVCAEKSLEGQLQVGRNGGGTGEPTVEAETSSDQYCTDDRRRGGYCFFSSRFDRRHADLGPTNKGHRSERASPSRL